MTQMINSYKDQIPLLVAVASVDQDIQGRDQLQEAESHDAMTNPITKWSWTAKTTASIPETLRRGLKFASTPPCGPVFLSLPNNTLRQEAKAACERPRQTEAFRDADQARRERCRKYGAHSDRANNPLISVGDEITWCHGEETVNWRSFWAFRSARARGARLGRSRSRPGSAHIERNGATCASRQGRRVAQPRQPVRRARLARTTLISIRLDPTSLAARRRSISAWWPTSASRRLIWSRRSQSRHTGLQGDRRGAHCAGRAYSHRCSNSA